MASGGASFQSVGWRPLRLDFDRWPQASSALLLSFVILGGGVEENSHPLVFRYSK